VNIELTILSGGLRVTGKTPTVAIRNKDTGFYFDFASNTFTATTVSATAVLTSAIDGLYTYSWNTQGVFGSDIYLTYEFHDATAIATDDVSFVTKPSGLGGGGVIVKGQWTAKQKKQLLDDINALKGNLSQFRIDAMVMLRKILKKDTLEKSDVAFFDELKERDKLMWSELLKILEMRNGSTTKEVVARLSEYLEKEEADKMKVMEFLDNKLEIPESKVEDDEEE